MPVLGVRRYIPLVLRHGCALARVYSTVGSVKSFVPSDQQGTNREMENNDLNESNRLSKTLTRFWDNVAAHHNPLSEKWDVKLDSKPLKTPLGFPLSLPLSKKQLAHLVAHEWANLPDLKVKTSAMPFTSVVARLIDLHQIHKEAESVTPEMIAKVGKLDDIKLSLLRYLDTDTCLIFATKKEYEGKLRAKQDQLYLPLIAETQDYFSKYAEKYHPELVPQGCLVKIKHLDCETQGLGGNKQDLVLQDIVYRWMSDLGIYDLIALEKTILTTKSFLCGVALLRSNGSDAARHDFYQVNRIGKEPFHMTIEQIVELGNLETIFQTEKWGEVEDTHDVDKVDWVRSLASAAILCY